MSGAEKAGAIVGSLVLPVVLFIIAYFLTYKSKARFGGKTPKVIWTIVIVIVALVAIKNIIMYIAA